MSFIFFLSFLFYILSKTSLFSNGHENHETNGQTDRQCNPKMLSFFIYMFVWYFFFIAFEIENLSFNCCHAIANNILSCLHQPEYLIMRLKLEIEIEVQGKIAIENKTTSLKKIRNISFIFNSKTFIN